MALGAANSVAVKLRDILRKTIKKVAMGIILVHTLTMPLLGMRIRWNLMRIKNKFTPF